jgi:hypothetical protein
MPIDGRQETDFRSIHAPDFIGLGWMLQNLPIYRPMLQSKPDRALGVRKRYSFFSFDTDFYRRVKARDSIEAWQGVSGRGLHASLDSFYRTARGRRQVRSGVTPFPLQLLPRRCPVCGNQTIIGHGRRRKQAYDQRHDWIWIRRGLCRTCRKAFTILPAWSPPYGHYSLHCRQQAWQSLHEAGSWEESVPSTKDPNRSPDPSTVRRWAAQLFWLGVFLVSMLWKGAGWIFGPPTILACGPDVRLLSFLLQNSPDVALPVKNTDNAYSFILHQEVETDLLKTRHRPRAKILELRIA